MNKLQWILVIGLVSCLLVTLVLFGVVVSEGAVNAIETSSVSEIPTTTDVAQEAVPTEVSQASFEFVDTPTTEPTEVIVPTATSTLTPSPTPTPVPPIIGYTINSSVDLASGESVAMVIKTVDGQVIKTNWASAIGYNEGDDANEVFSPYKGTVYSHIDGGFLATWAHSGRLKETDLFAWNLEKAVYLNQWGGILKLSEGHDLAEGNEETQMPGLIGASMFLCQTDTFRPFEDFNPDEPCPGRQIEFIVTAAALVERENVEAYEAAVGNTVSWLIANAQGRGFENMNPQTGYLIQTCVGRYKDQKSDGTKDYLFNRLILGLTLRE